MNDAERAVRDRLRRDPTDWQAALDLKRHLRAALHYPESDELFRQAGRYLPDDEWLDYYGALYAFHEDNLAPVAERARSMLARRPGDPRLLAILGEVAAQQRDWPAAAAAFAAAHRAEPRETWRHAAATAGLYQRLAPTIASAPAPDYAIAFVNLDRNPDRERSMRGQFAAWGPALLRQPGVEGGRLPIPAIRRLGGDPAMRGTLGCFLSHAAAWEAMLARGDQACLFLEDDVIPLTATAPALAALGVPSDADLVFVNDRLAPRLDPAAATGFTVHTLAAAMTLFPPDDNAPGGDGYVLSRTGAAKLLDWLAEDGFSEDVDWRLIAYGLTPDEIAALPRPSHAGPWLERIAAVVRRPDRVAAYVLHPPLIRTVGVSSEREDENRGEG